MAVVQYSAPAPNFPLPTSRADLEALIEAAILRLDELDGDCDLEDDDPAEHALGWSRGEWEIGRLGFGADWTEPNGDEEDFSGIPDEFFGWSKPLDYRDAVAIRSHVVEGLQKVIAGKITS